MRIEIDTKEDLHNLHHVVRFLQAIQTNHKGKYQHDDAYSTSTSSSLFSESSTPSQTPPATGAGLFGMFDSSPSTTTDSSPSSSSSSATSDAFASLFSNPEVKKDDDNSKDFLDSLQVY